ncbi:magnesium dechelatase SGRL, chloroplastic-like [Dioscorea cayenensis subsp. rotundata]|uniref:Magnesium dechelatase SGRL, chloroplastic-like n=1 Tax=Dioscorea cayennensis subsp. rotundata TaxID=55577 RepID=A0AB40AXF9_DIOCR|nr:magnesium dechelatase SGRL, chloroplastic-like [Dioscorea cayenensis subsp. rotundata]
MEENISNILLLFSFLMTSLSARNAFITSFSMSRVVPSKPFVVCSCDRRDYSLNHGSLVLKAATLLSPPTRFEASKLKVVFMGEEMENQPFCSIPRAYTLTHCDFTANLTLAVSKDLNIYQLREFKTRLERDDVLAEWKKVDGEVSLYVHCYVSGANLLQELATEFRYYIFSKELPLVLKAVVHGDSVLFDEHPELMEAKVWVYFHSKSIKYNRVECWGALKDAMQRTLNSYTSSDIQHAVMERIRNSWNTRTIFHALVSFLL